MHYAVWIAAAFILATVAIATLSPFDHLPQAAPQQSAAAAPPPAADGSAADSSSYDDNGSNGVKGQWPPGEAPPE